MKTFKVFESNGFYADLSYFFFRLIKGRKHYYIEGSGGARTAFASDVEGNEGWTAGGSRRIKISEKQFGDLMGIDDTQEAHEYVKDIINRLYFSGAKV